MPSFESADELRRHYADVRARLGGPAKQKLLERDLPKPLPPPLKRVPAVMIRPPRPARPARPMPPPPPKPKVKPKPKPEPVAEALEELEALGSQWTQLEIGRASPRMATAAICRFFGVRPRPILYMGELRTRGRAKFILAVVVAYLRRIHRRSDQELSTTFNLKMETVSELLQGTDELFTKVFPRGNLFLWLARLHGAARRDEKGCLTIQSKAAPDASAD